LNLAQALRRKGDHAAAIEIYEQTIAAGRATADLYMNLGLAYLDMGEPVRAEDYFREGIETNPEFHLNYYYAGVACQRQGRRHQARQAWKLFLERHRETDLAEEVRRRLRED
jgi:tetratricopeptide (TPR) repeat protein